MLAVPEALDRERPQPELALLLPQLGPAVHVHALAVSQVEPEGVELAAGHRRGQAGAAVRILEREEDRLPRRLPA